MKQFFLTITAALALAGGYAQQNGNVITREIFPGNFTSLDLSGAMNVYLKQGDKTAVLVEADEKVQDKIEAATNGNVLYVKTKEGNWSNVKKMNVYITVTNLDEIRNKLVGKLTGETVIKQGTLRYKSSAVGNTNLQLEVQNLQIDVSAVGNTTLELNAQDLKANISAIGNTTLSGKAVHCELRNSSVGNVRAAGLLVDNMELYSTAIGNLEYNAKNTVSVKSTGIGKVVNKGRKETR